MNGVRRTLFRSFHGHLLVDSRETTVEKGTSAHFTHPSRRVSAVQKLDADQKTAVFDVDIV